MKTNSEITPEDFNGGASKKKQNFSTKSYKNFFCIGIGASAGGLEALEGFFRNMSPEPNAAFVVVQHLSPDYKSLMVELLSKYTKLKVVRAEDGMPIVPNCIYLIPPKKNMTIFHNKLFLSEPVHHQVPNLPIDIFFRSLAEDFSDRAIGIVLSGTGSDGTLGIRAIKGAGGMIMAQNDISAKFDGMPRSAISTGLVDYVLPAEEMPEKLLKFIHHPFLEKKTDYPTISENDNSLNKIMAIIRSRVGVDFAYYKPTTIIRRLEKRISIHQIQSVESYVGILEKSNDEVNLLYKELLIGVTKFFRDQEAFDLIKNEIFPKITIERSNKTPIRIWSVGCSTGEEAYSLAILLCEYMEETGHFFDAKIYATDLDKDSLEIASVGFYPESIITDVSPEHLKKYFIRKNKGFYVKESIRKMIVFAAHNVINDPPFSRIDLITCRNMLIYLKPEMQRRIISLFHFSLNEKGYMFLGPSESLGELSSHFTIQNSKWKIYQHKYVPRYETFNNFMMPSQNKKSQSDKQQELEQSVAVASNPITDDVFNAIIEDFLPPSLIVNRKLDVVHICKDVNRYIRISPGKLTTNVMSLIRKELRSELNIGLTQVIQSNKQFICPDISFREQGNNIHLSLNIKPLKDNSELIFIGFEEKREDLIKYLEKTNVSLSNDADTQITGLEQELKLSKENLQATVEELATSNEELQTTNEELISSNEELQSTNEELQSVNQELYTVNSEYQNKIEELIDLNNDINNLLINTNIGTIFLDRKLLIRRFTPAAAETVNILEMDIGRPFHHISHNIFYRDFNEDIENVLRTLKTKQTEIQSKNGKWFLVRILPYRTLDNAVEGIVITFLDITDRKNFEHELEQNAQLLTSVLDYSPIAKIITDHTFTITYGNEMAEKLFEIPLSEIKNGKYSTDMLHFTDANGKPLTTEKSPLVKVIKEQYITDEIIHRHNKNGTTAILSVNGSSLKDNAGNFRNGIFTFHDITHKKQLEDQLQKERQLFSQVLQNNTHANLLLDKTGEITFINYHALNLFNLSSGYDKPLHLKDLKIKAKSSDRTNYDIFQDVISGAKPVFNVEHRMSGKPQMRFQVTGTPVFSGNNEVSGVLLTMDIMNNK
jgi:two-component system, chemotaxis family, CheB/CheR fusion protein